MKSKKAKGKWPSTEEKKEGEEEKTPSTKELTKIGKKIGMFFKKLEIITHEQNFFRKELEDFESYLNTQEAVGPLFSPEAFIGRGMFKNIDRARARVKVIKHILRELDKI